MRGLGGRKLPRFTRCYDVVSGHASLTDERVVQALFVFVVLGLLGLGHVYTRFSVREMRLQHKEYQRVLLDLRQQAARLRTENETLCDISRLHEYGLRELNMVDTQPGTATTASVDPALRAKYLPEGFDSAAAYEMAVAHRETKDEDKPLQRIIGRLFEPDRAYAGEQGRTKR